MTENQDVLSALTAEGEEVGALVAGLDPQCWNALTPAPEWTVAHQVAHLIANFRLAGLAASKPDAFRSLLATLSDDFDANVRGAMAEHLQLSQTAMVERFHESLAFAVNAIRAVPADQTVPWLVNPLPPAVLASAGMMELIGHGQDIVDAVGAPRKWTDRIGYVVGFAVRTRDFGYLAHGLTPPAEEFRFELTSPSGKLWEFGPVGAAQRVTGPAADFCLLVTRRRHHGDLRLKATGILARQWLGIAQAYRGPSGQGRQPGQFADAKA